MDMRATLDEWHPSPKNNAFRIPSKWRIKQAARMPGLDDVRKICVYIRNGVNEDEIMKVFKIKQKTLNEIRENRYDPVSSFAKEVRTVSNNKKGRCGKKINGEL